LVDGALRRPVDSGSRHPARPPPWLRSRDEVDRQRQDGWIQHDRRRSRIRGLHSVLAQEPSRYWKYADRFVLSDHFFTSMFGPTSPEHIYTVARQSRASSTTLRTRQIPSSTVTTRPGPFPAFLPGISKKSQREDLPLSTRLPLRNVLSLDRHSRSVSRCKDTA
jgi:hypothetical protein